MKVYLLAALIFLGLATAFVSVSFFPTTVQAGDRTDS
jgi:hypothetical protein